MQVMQEGRLFATQRGTLGQVEICDFSGWDEQCDSARVFDNYRRKTDVRWCSAEETDVPSSDVSERNSRQVVGRPS